MKHSRSAKGLNGPALSETSDIHASALYQEAETLFRQLFKPGSGRPTGATELAVAPDRTQVAFTGTLMEKLEGAPTTRICMVDLKTGELRVLSFGPNADLTPKFSPDGKQLAFRSDRARPGDFQLYLMDLRSGETQAAQVAPGWVEYLEYSPDGTRILLGVAGHGADVAGAQGAKASKKSQTEQAAAWMPVVQTGDEEFKRRSLWILNLASGALGRASPAALNVWEACWCGNGALAAVVTRGAAEEDWYRAHLVHIALPSGKATVLHRPKDQLEWLSGSPDGRQLAFVEAVCSDRWLVAGDLRIINLKTSKLRSLATKKIDITFTRWRNNGRLLLAGIRDFETVVADMDVASGMLHERWVSEELYCQNFVYPAAAAVPGSDDSFVIAASGHLKPMELLQVKGTAVRKFFGFRHDGTATVIGKLRPLERYRWKAPDGTEIHGWLMRGSGKKAAPLVMEVHGGPIYRWPPYFLGRSIFALMLAERGFAMFWPNPRGSSGRGQDYARAVIGDMGGAETQDHLSGLDQLVAEGIVDPKRIGVTGASHGGFMTSWLITQDSRFAAAVAVAPVTHWASQHLTSNIPFFDTMSLGSTYTDPKGDHYARSPVMHAQKVKTPTLNICGALDRCTPPGQAQEFHSALLENGVKSVLVTYPQEGHGVRTFPGMIDYAARMVDWFTQHMPTKRVDQSSSTS